MGAYEHPWNGKLKQGRAFVFSGQSGRLLRTFDLPQASVAAGSASNPYQGAAFGFAVASAGDVDQDQVPDLLIGAFGHGGSGRACVFSGKTGTLLSTLQAPQQRLGNGFGWAVASLGDVTTDGVPELLVGAFAQEGEGRVFVFSGKEGTVLRTLAPPPPSSNGAFGWSVAGPGDLDKDGTPDIVVGAPYTTVRTTPVQGRVYAFSGRSGKLLYILDDPQPRAGAVFGWQIASGGDFNADGVPDVLVGAPYKEVGTSRAQGEAFVFSGADGKVLLRLSDPAPKPYSGFGLSAATSPDMNQDGIAEIVVGAPYQTVDQFHIQGEVFLFNGRDGRHLATFDNPCAGYGG